MRRLEAGLIDENGPGRLETTSSVYRGSRQVAQPYRNGSQCYQLYFHRTPEIQLVV